MSRLTRIRVLKITRSPGNGCWYDGMVGQYVPLEGFDRGYWRSREPAGYVNFIAEDDAKPVWGLVTASALSQYPWRHSKEAQAALDPLGYAPQRPAPGQSRRHSLVETVTCVAVGFVVSLAITAWLLPAMGHQVTATENVLMTSVFTVASVLRGYALRRLFNRWAA